MARAAAAAAAIAIAAVEVSDVSVTHAPGCPVDCRTHLMLFEHPPPPSVSNALLTC